MVPNVAIQSEILKNYFWLVLSISEKHLNYTWNFIQNTFSIDKHQTVISVHKPGPDQKRTDRKTGGHFENYFFVTKIKASYISTPATRLRQSCISTWPGTRWRWCPWRPKTDHSQFSLSKTQSNWSNGCRRTTVWWSGPRAIWTSESSFYKFIFSISTSI